MRMRRKKHREERLESCAEIMIQDIFEYSSDLCKAFDRTAPLHLEIGCGKGGFISTLAELNPDINYIAFEKNLDVLVLAAEKVAEKGLTNVKFVPGDAEALGQLDEQQSAERLYINFCDPWHKWGHRKRRLTHERYLAIYERLMKDGGEIHFKTDNAPLFEFSLNSFSDYGMKLKNITLDLHNSRFEGNVMTEYEKLFSEKGQPIYRCEAIFCQR
ncbi:MAG: tRNA (guanosine(46)-N7)-methyltransferase TrmB [Ruminococcaceae bacterium]|nr:tRNA (guanosine(46)-N7)-methyltransferase TrmB [Oscillospiraceae bacterium]